MYEYGLCVGICLLVGITAFSFQPREDYFSGNLTMRNVMVQNGLSHGVAVISGSLNMED